MEITHVPVMLEEVLEMLKVKASGVYIDGTVGLGGHAEGIFRKAGECTVIGLDRDEQALEIAGQRLKGRDVHLVKDSFSNMDSVARELGYEQIDGVVLDLGVSTLQLRSEDRGFSFLKDEPLDMRMDKGQGLTAGKIVNEYPEKELAHVLWHYGEERFSRRIARAIVYARSKAAIKTCRELSGIIERAVRSRGRIHPATRSFQALRIEVNRELAELSMAIEPGINILRTGGRFCVLSYHSLEDRVVKRSFRDFAHKGIISLITKKPLVPKQEEKQSNPSSRSAKLRVAEKI